MRFSRLFSKRNKKRSKLYSAANHPSWGRIARMETLEDRRVLANFYVFGNGDSIQDAIDQAENHPGPDTVFLKSDNYYQSVYISDNNPLTVVGLGNVYLNPDSNEDTIRIRDSYHVTLKNLTVRNAEGDNIDAENTYKLELYDIHSLNADDDGLDAEHVDYIFAHNSKFNGNDDNGIELRNVGYAYLKNVEASDNGFDGGTDSNDNGLVYENWQTGDQVETALIADTFPGKLKVYGGEFSHNRRDGIHTAGIQEIYIEMLYANDNGDDGVDNSNSMGTAQIVDINYATFNYNGEDGLDTSADYVEITSTRGLHNDENGVAVEDSYKAYIFYSDYSYNGEKGIKTDDVSIVTIDWVAANGNGRNIPNTGASIVDVDDLDITTSEFNYNQGDGIFVEMNYGGHTYINYVDASHNTDDGLDLRDGSAHIESFSSNSNDDDGIRTEDLKYLYIYNTESKYNGSHGLRILGGRKNDTVSAELVNGNSEFHGTNVYIVWSEFVGNHEDGIHAENAGHITLDRMQSIYNRDDGFESINPWVPATVIDSLFAHNGDRNFVEIFQV